MTQLTSSADGAGHWRQRTAELLAPAYARYSDLVVEWAEGARLHTVDGRSILDFTCGIGVTNLGHNHPAVVAAVHRQVDKLMHTSVTALHPTAASAAEALVSIAPPGLDQVFLCNSGAEAVEAAIKLSRKATRRTEIIAFTGAFHGRTYGALSLTASKQSYRAGVGPLLPGVHHVEYPYCARCNQRNGHSCCRSDGRDIERLFATRVNPHDVAAIVVEPVLGEGGYVVPPAEFLPSLRRICDTNGILLIADEVQTGFGRTGRNFAVEHTGTRPDILCVAKALGNGLPIAGIVASRQLMAAWQPGDHGTTFGGNPVSCAAAVAVIETLQRERLADRSARLGDVVLDRASQWATWSSPLVDVRGLGLMVGLEFRRSDGSAASDVVNALRAAALRRDLLVLSCGTEDNVIRLLPPLTIDETELATGLDIFEAALEEVSR